MPPSAVRSTFSMPLSTSLASVTSPKQSSMRKSPKCANCIDDREYLDENVSLPLYSQLTGSIVVCTVSAVVAISLSGVTLPN
eukprot:4887251-Pleurochrysis_carterae.AAC.1